MASRLRTSVLKFGGSSVGSADSMRHVAGILLASRDAGSRTVGVLSAMFGVTNRLLDISQRAAARGDAATLARLRGALLDAHVATARALCGSASPAAIECSDYLQATTVRFVDDVCRDIRGKGLAEASDTDAISSVGERWSSRILASYMQSQGHDAPFVESDDIIVTSAESGNARPILDLSRARTDLVLVPMLARGATPIVTGFFGAAEAEAGRPRKVTTLGRGGSDLSAAVLGHCLDATDVSLYKVEYTTRPDGWMDAWAEGWVGVVHDADPSLTIDRLSYEEAHELAHFAKKVLHPETVSPAVQKAIPIAVRNTLDPSHPGTRIGPGSSSASASAGASSSSSVRNRYEGAGAAHSSSQLPLDAASQPSPAASIVTTAVPGAALQLPSPYSRHAANGGGRASRAAVVSAPAVAAASASAVESLELGRVQTVTKVPLKVYEAKNAPLADLDLSALDIKREEAALVVLVGLQVMQLRDIEARVTAVLRDKGIPVYVPRRVNGSENNFSVVVPESQRNAAVDLLHRAFVVGEAWRRRGAQGGSARVEGGAQAASSEPEAGVRADDASKPAKRFFFPQAPQHTLHFEVLQ